MHPPDAAICAARLSPRLEAVQHLLKRSNASVTPAVPAPQRRHKGPIPSESTVPTLRRLRLSRLLKLCLSACGDRKAAPLHACRRATHLWMLWRFKCHCHFSSLQLTQSLCQRLAVSYSNTPSLQPNSKDFLMNYSCSIATCTGRQKTGS